VVVGPTTVAQGVEPPAVRAGWRRYTLLNKEFFVEEAGTISSRCSSAPTRVRHRLLGRAFAGLPRQHASQLTGRRTPARQRPEPPTVSRRVCHVAARCSSAPLRRSPTSCAGPTSRPAGPHHKPVATAARRRRADPAQVPPRGHSSAPTRPVITARLAFGDRSRRPDGEARPSMLVERGLFAHAHPCQAAACSQRPRPVTQPRRAVLPRSRRRRGRTARQAGHHVGCEGRSRPG
jgi:hypothetical protein